MVDSAIGSAVRLPKSKEQGPGAEAYPLEILQLEEDSNAHAQWDGDWKGWSACDDVKGGPLPAHLVHSARLKELQYLKDRKVYT